ncbi:ABC transporter permease subunit [Robertmurraya massiliosenegalensis]|uniref:ABC transporter permease subunit n=1 Tax=Robertmurraya massiliosenegalensis TaxID=1287657 RepID=UPI0002FC5656|nr:ABC transporter permease subunit [Robertmurraya massiliosenegalensis]
MGWELIKSSLVFFLIVIAFILLLLLPREMNVVHHGGLVFTADFPFTLDLYKENIAAFIQHFQTEKGFGNNSTGVPIVEEVQKLLIRDFTIILPALFLSMVIGTLLGVVQFYFREKIIGKVQAFFSWILSSIPDFFLFIAIQYLLIKLFHVGLPQFSLYGNDHWYNFLIPMIAITVFPMVHMMKFTAASLENEVGQDYLRTARSKGLKTLSILKHMLWNCLYSILNQTQFVMLYILTSLPIMEKLSSFQGAGYHLLGSILAYDEPRALAFMLPYLLIMFATIILSKRLKYKLLPRKTGELR